MSTLLPATTVNYDIVVGGRCSTQVIVKDHCPHWGYSGTNTHNSPVGIGEADEGKLFGAVQDQVLCHLAEMSGAQGGPEQELRWPNADTWFREKQKTREYSRGFLHTDKVPLARRVHAVQTDGTEVQLCRSRCGSLKIPSHYETSHRLGR